jgi:hypothetical protein
MAMTQPPSMALRVLALRSARQEIKRHLKAQGVKVALMSARDITLLAEQFLAAHWEALMEEARAMVMSSPELRAMYEREQAKRRQRFNETKICTTPEDQQDQGLLPCEY